MVKLVKITLTCDAMKECIALDVLPEKKEYVYSNAIMLACAYDFNAKGKIMECRAIYADSQLVGMIAYNYYVGDPVFKETCYRIRPFMIDKNHAENGYEKAALEKLLEEIRTKPHGDATAIFATYDPEEDDMAELYKSVGFTKTSMNWQDEDPDDNDIIARMDMN